MGGWIIATAAWLVSRIALDHGVGDGHLAADVRGGPGKLRALHCDVRRNPGGRADAQAGVDGYPHWLGLAVAGNICGGVLMVTLLEYGQAICGKSLSRGDGERAISPRTSRRCKRPSADRTMKTA